MLFVVIVINPDGMQMLEELCRQLSIPLVVSMWGHGTANKNILDYLGITSRDRRIAICLASEGKTARLITAVRRYLYLDIPGNGILMTVPVKSVGGTSFMAYLSEEKPVAYCPKDQYAYELIVALANEGYTDTVMDAARAGGATGGTILHGKGSGYSNVEKFFLLSIAKEKEVILIVTDTARKKSVMQSILRDAGPKTKADAMVFSLPVDEIAGFPNLEHSEDPTE